MTTVSIVQPQLAVGKPHRDHRRYAVLTSVNQVVNQISVSSVISAAEANWNSALVAAGGKAYNFSNVKFQFGNIGHGILADTSGSVITIDSGAAGFGWYVNVGAVPLSRQWPTRQIKRPNPDPRLWAIWTS